MTREPFCGFPIFKVAFYQWQYYNDNQLVDSIIFIRQHMTIKQNNL